MKSSLKICIGLALLCAASAQAQISLQNFSSVVNPSLTVFAGSWEATGIGASENPNSQFVQNYQAVSGTYAITGTSGAGLIMPTNSADSYVDLYLPSPTSISGNPFLAVTAQTISTNLASGFTVFLYDTSGKTADAGFSTSSFPTGGYTTAYSTIANIQSGFNYTIEYIRITGNIPGGTSQFNVSFDNISAVSAIPEPSTYAAILGAACLGFVIVRRQKSSGEV
jgi:hypothetical protein